MRSTIRCSRHLQLLRQSKRVENSSPTQLYSHGTKSTRLVSSSSQPFQNAAPDPKPYTQPPPITTGTVTANPTAAPPEAIPVSTTTAASNAKSKIPDLSTGEMQRHLASQLGKTRGSALTDSLARSLRKTAKSATESYITYGLTEAFFKSCSAQTPYTIPEDQRTRILTDKGPPKTAGGEDLGIAEADTFWFDTLGLQPTFSTWSQITYLHMYILTVRLRALDDVKQFQDYQRYLIEHFSNAAEDKMVLLHSINARGIRNKYLKDLFIQWRGLLAAYDEGLIEGDAVLASAVWRNIWKGSEDVDWEKVAIVVAYMRRAISGLSTIPLDELTQNLDGGRRVWEEARRNITSTVAQKSKGIAEPL